LLEFSALPGIIESFKRGAVMNEISANVDAVYAHSEDIVAREIEGELIIVPLASGIGDMEDELFTLNETGRLIWGNLDGKKPLKDIVKELAGNFDASEGAIQEDVVGLVGELLKRRMVVEVSQK
jgi:hypothetical protein